MKELNFREEKVQVREVLHKLKNISNLLEREKEMCIQYENWGIPVSLVSENKNDIFTYSHADQYFSQNNELDQLMREREQPIYHIQINIISDAEI